MFPRERRKIIKNSRSSSERDISLFIGKFPCTIVLHLLHFNSVIFILVLHAGQLVGMLGKINTSSFNLNNKNINIFNHYINYYNIIIDNVNIIIKNINIFL